MKNILESYKKELKEIHENCCDRKINSFKKEGKYIFEENKRYLNLSSNDYMGIAEDKKFLKDL